MLILGTIVTGSGPHAGDEKAQRFGFDIRTVAWLHADVVIAFIGLLVGYLLLLRFAPVVVDDQLTRARNREARTLLLITLAQGAIGYTQYFTGLPWVLVAIHVLGACLLWIYSVRLYLARNTRGARA